MPANALMQPRIDGTMQATPRNALLGYIADALNAANNYANKPNPAMPMGKANPPLSMLANALGVGDLGATADNLSYGRNLTQGQGMARQMLPETANALLTAGPLAAKFPKQAAAVTAGLLSGGDVAASRAIVPAAFVRAEGKAATLPTDQLFADAVANTPGAKIAEDGLTLAVQRNQNPNQGLMPSVRGGVFYLPEGAPQAKHYSTGKNGYGGTEKIAGETLLQNPMFVKGATGGKAPEAALDMLQGKGAYQAMRTDALKAYGPYGGGTAARIQATREFLAKYAPELADQADYIVKNSAQGNQLAYALQEAAVGSAVRNAGHDAVLGYSKAKTGNPFISELFDVRERTYPDKFGGFNVWGNE